MSINNINFVIQGVLQDCNKASLSVSLGEADHTNFNWNQVITINFISDVLLSEPLGHADTSIKSKKFLAA